jgi:hypothetical protein
MFFINLDTYISTLLTGVPYITFSGFSLAKTRIVSKCVFMEGFLTLVKLVKVETLNS